MYQWHKKKTKLVTVFPEKTDAPPSQPPTTTGSQDFVQTRKCHANADANGIITKNNMSPSPKAPTRTPMESAPQTICPPPHSGFGGGGGKQKAHGPWLAHLSEIATADMQMLCNIFPILSLQLMKGSTFVQSWFWSRGMCFLLLFFYHIIWA